MQSQFKNGYALLIGVSEQKHANIATLGGVKNDVENLHAILTNPDYCAYPPENVSSLLGEDATRDNIEEKLLQLKEKIKGNRKATVFIYFSGHGHRNDQGQFFLIPYEANYASDLRLEGSALKDSLWKELIDDMNPKELVVVMDCCFAGASEVKNGDRYKNGQPSLPKPPTLPDKTHGETTTSKPKPTESPYPLEFLNTYPKTDENSEEPSRFVMHSSGSKEVSWMTQNNTVSLFTHHLIEALLGHGVTDAKQQEIRVSDVMGYLTRKVVASSDKKQNPRYKQFGSDFSMAKLAGGKGIQGEKLPTTDEFLSEVQAPTPAPVVEKKSFLFKLFSDIKGAFSFINTGINIQNPGGDVNLPTKESKRNN